MNKKFWISALVLVGVFYCGVQYGRRPVTITLVDDGYYITWKSSPDGENGLARNYNTGEELLVQNDVDEPLPAAFYVRRGVHNQKVVDKYKTLPPRTGHAPRPRNRKS